MEKESHPICQPISHVQIPSDEHGNPLDFIVGKHGVTKIEGCSKNGEYCLIPYIRVWAGEFCLAEFSQHKASFVIFEPVVLPPAPAANPNLPF